MYLKNKLENTNAFVDLPILKYLILSLDLQQKCVYIYIYIYIYIIRSFVICVYVRV